MTGIIFNTVIECEALIKEINTKFSNLFRGVSNNYTHYIKHREQELYAVVIDLKSLQEITELDLQGMSKSVEDIVVLGEDWVDKTDLDFYGV